MPDVGRPAQCGLAWNVPETVPTRRLAEFRHSVPAASQIGSDRNLARCEPICEPICDADFDAGCGAPVWSFVFTKLSDSHEQAVFTQ